MRRKISSLFLLLLTLAIGCSRSTSIGKNTESSASTDSRPFSECVPGKVGCACKSDGSCDGDLICDVDMCIMRNPGTSGVYADIDIDTDTDADTGTPDTAKIKYDTTPDAEASFDFNLSGLPFVGVNMSGPEWDGGANGAEWPNQYLTRDYESYLKFFRSWGMTTVRLPFKWEYLQPKLGKAFDEAELEKMKITVFHLREYRAKVLIDMHNYARYGNDLIGSQEVSFEDYADAWRRLAEIFKPYPEVMFGIMNEPYDMPTMQWVAGANAAIKAIRDAGAQNLIFVNGNGWSGAHNWEQTWPDTPDEAVSNAEAMLLIDDPLGDDHLIFEVHQYLNENSSDWGICECTSWDRTNGCADETVGTFRMQGFTDWLRLNNRKGFLGEFGAKDDSVCISALDDQLKHVEENDDVYVGWTWWAAGPGCTSWQRPIDPECWDEQMVDDLKKYLNGEGDGTEIYPQAKLLIDHLVRY
ncbi:MAG: glycoside hydrolase family 5 protein [Deltaproteobacteria bacterium]|nr:glycoside hydrolase family 5 protein [Deltaproteobacteria bacterium]